jgi:hypothetical protein
MTGYERCLETMARRPADRVPAYTPTVASDVASLILGRPAHTGGPALWHAEADAWCRGESCLEDFDARVEEDIIDLHRALGQDVIRFPWRLGLRPTARIDAFTFRCGEGDGAPVWRWDPDTPNFFPINGNRDNRVEDWPAMARAAQDQADGRLARIREQAGIPERRLQERLGGSMLVVAGGAGLSLGVDEPSLMAALLEPAAVADLLDCQLAAALEQVRALACRGVKAVLGGGDMADKNGPLYSPELFGRFMLPRWKKIAGACREAGLHYVWRSDGNLWKVADMLFREAALPGFGEVDHEASMAVRAVRARFPELVLWGCLSGDLIRRGSPGEVYQHSREALEASSGRGYFHGCSNTILPGTPPANVAAMMRARDDFKG